MSKQTLRNAVGRTLPSAITIVVVALLTASALLLAWRPVDVVAQEGGWSAMGSGTSNALSGVWGSSGSDVFAVGEGGTILHYDGSSWSAMTSDTSHWLHGVWGSSGSDVFAVGSGGTILHYDGSSWSAMSSGTSNYLAGVWGSSGSDVFAVGSGGTILHYSRPIYVDREATGANSGYSWQHAFTDLPDALAAAGDGDQIWVAEGTYKPTSGTDRTASFQMENGVGIYGGFDPSVGDITWEDRDWATHVTILSGDIGAAGVDSDNVYHVFHHPSGRTLDGSAILDGFTITGGNANGAYPHERGGGMFNEGSSPTLSNCTFTDNSAVAGGAIYNAGSSPVLANCTFSGNSAEYGGGMSNDQSSPALTNCSFWGNSATSSGGGIYNYQSSPVLTNCILWGDSPSEIFDDDSSPVVTYSDVQGGYFGRRNIDADPLFVDPANGDYHLGAGSPCIDAGDNDAPDLPLYDFEGDDRILDGDGIGKGVVDMGVDEFSGGGSSQIEVEIDITPDTPSNIIKLGPGAAVPVAILTTSEFDAGTVDPDTVLFAGAAPIDDGELVDVDGDGDLDLLLEFDPRDLELDTSDRQATLTGETFDGVLIEGTDKVKVK